MQEIISVRNVFKNYTGVTALSGVSFDVSKGEIFGLIGPDGAGKTSLFRILATLLVPASGAVHIQGLDTVKDYKKIRRILGYMPGRFSLYMDLTVQENLEFYATIFSTTIAENYYLIENIYKYIEPFRDRLAKDLSGGMKQKLALSCALIHKPSVIILDEPTTGVDAVSRKEFWDMLKKLREYGITIIVSTPYMDEAALCDRVALINKGKLLDIDSPGKIVEKFQGVLISVHSADKYRLLSDLREFKSGSHAFLFGDEVHYSNDTSFDGLKELEGFLRERNHEGLRIRTIMPGIEDCFIRLMNE